MAGVLGADPKEELHPSSFGSPVITRKLQALEHLRMGKVALAIATFYNSDVILNTAHISFNRTINHSNFYTWGDFDLFLKEMESIAKDLVEAGL